MEILAKKGRLVIAEKGEMVYVSGTIDADSDFSPILQLKRNKLMVSMKGVEQVTSNGVSQLLNLVRSLGDRPFEFHECPVETIGMFTIVPALLEKPSCRLRSFYANYICEECDREQMTLCRPEEFRFHGDGEVQAPIRTCSLHGNMDFDDEIEDFILICQK